MMDEGVGPRVITASDAAADGAVLAQQFAEPVTPEERRAEAERRNAAKIAEWFPGPYRAGGDENIEEETK